MKLKTFLMIKIDRLKTFVLKLYYFNQIFVKPNFHQLKYSLKNINWIKVNCTIGFGGAGLTSGIILIAPPDRRERRNSSVIEMVFFRSFAAVICFPFAFSFFANWPVTIPLSGYYSFCKKMIKD